jgi:hypothetical protein
MDSRIATCNNKVANICNSPEVKLCISSARGGQKRRKKGVRNRFSNSQAIVFFDFSITAHHRSAARRILRHTQRNQGVVSFQAAPSLVALFYSYSRRSDSVKCIAASTTSSGIQRGKLSSCSQQLNRQFTPKLCEMLAMRATVFSRKKAVLSAAGNCCLFYDAARRLATSYASGNEHRAKHLSWIVVKPQQQC